MASERSKRRDALVRDIADLRAWLEAAELRMGAADNAAVDAFLTRRGELAGLNAEYRSVLPRPTLSRCPFSGAALAHSIDPWGLDGPWWDANHPFRPAEDLPDTLIVFSGAMRLGSPLESTSYLVLPGAQVPVVSRTLLAYPEVRAVVSSLPVGQHTAYPIAYFADPPLDLPPTVATWGTRRWRLPDPDLDLEVEIIEEEDDLDADLESWIRRGKLLWIAPGDPDHRLHATVRGCPFLGLEGSKMPTRVMYGQILESET